MEWKGKPISQSLEKYLNRAREIAKRRGDLVVDSDHFSPPYLKVKMSHLQSTLRGMG